jgi:hypothetical protein
VAVLDKVFTVLVGLSTIHAFKTFMIQPWISGEYIVTTVTPQCKKKQTQRRFLSALHGLRDCWSCGVVYNSTPTGGL